EAELAEAVVAPAADAAIGPDRARVKVTRRDRDGVGETAHRPGDEAEGEPPALDGAVAEERAAVPGAGSDGDDDAHGLRPEQQSGSELVHGASIAELARLVGAPAEDDAVHPERAGVKIARGDRHDVRPEDLHRR